MKKNQGSECGWRCFIPHPSSFILCVFLSITLPLITPAASAQNYPTKPVRVIVAYPAGGPVDITARALASKLTAALGQPIVVDNRSGAGGIVGSDLVAKAAPDGYTLLMCTTSRPGGCVPSP